MRLFSIIRAEILIINFGSEFLEFRFYDRIYIIMFSILGVCSGKIKDS
jgi:hypothetical protein